MMNYNLIMNPLSTVPQCDHILRQPVFFDKLTYNRLLSWTLQDICALVPLPRLPELSELWDTTAALIFLGWFLFQVLLQMLPTGYIAEGLPLRTGKRLKYRCNGK